MYKQIKKLVYQLAHAKKQCTQHCVVFKMFAILSSEQGNY